MSSGEADGSYTTSNSPFVSVRTEWVARAQLVYAGGAIDYIKDEYHKTDSWQHRLADLAPHVAVYCPKCANEGRTNPHDIIEHNMRMMLEVASRAVFVFQPDHFTMGTPIEAWSWASRRDPRAMCIVHPARPGIFVRAWADAGAHLTETIEGAAAWLIRGTP